MHVVLSSFLMRALRLVTLFCTSVMLFVTTVGFAFAADSAVRSALDQAAAGPRGSGFKNICTSATCVGTILGGLINIVLGLMGVALVGYILYAGFLWMTSSGDDKQVESARTMIRNAVIGVAIIGASYTLTSTMVQLVGDTFTSTGPTTLAQPETPSTPSTTPAPTPTVTPGPTFTDPFASNCTRTSCTNTCITQECGALHGQVRFTCETSCHDRCQMRCALDGAGAATGASGADASGSGPPPTSLPTPDVCRDAAGYRRCQDACAPAAEARTAGILDVTTRIIRYNEELDLCNQRCTRENCSP